MTPGYFPSEMAPVYFPSEINVAKIVSGEIQVAYDGPDKVQRIPLSYMDQPGIQIQLPSLMVARIYQKFPECHVELCLDGKDARIQEAVNFMCALDERILDLAVENVAKWDFIRSWINVNTDPKTDEQRKKVRASLNKFYVPLIFTLDKPYAIPRPFIKPQITIKSGLYEEDSAHIDSYETQVYETQLYHSRYHSELRRIRGSLLKKVFVFRSRGAPVLDLPCVIINRDKWFVPLRLIQFRIDSFPSVVQRRPMFRPEPVAPTAPPRPKDEDPSLCRDVD